MVSRSAYLQLFSEFFPVLAFFIAGEICSFMTASIVLIVTTLLSLVVSVINLGKIPFMPIFSGSIVFVFGGLTLFLNQPDFLIFADSFYFFVLAIFIAIGFGQEKHFLQRIFDQTIAMQPQGWRILSRRWLIALLLAGLANEFVRLAFEPEVWIKYRFVKILLLTGFALYQIKLSRKYRIREESNTLGLRVSSEL